MEAYGYVSISLSFIAVTTWLLQLGFPCPTTSLQPAQILTVRPIEYLPFIRRWEYDIKKLGKPEWQYVTFPLNKGETRDIPHGTIDIPDSATKIPHSATFHYSVIERMQLSPNTDHPKNQTSIGNELSPDTYRPKNQTSIGNDNLKLHEAISQAIKNGTAPRKDGIYLEYSPDVKTPEKWDCVFKIMPPTTASMRS